MTLVWLIRVVPPPGCSDWIRREQVTQSWPMRLSSETFVGAIGEAKFFVSEGLPGACRGHQVEKAFLTTKPTQRKAEKNHEEKNRGPVLNILSCWIQPYLIHTRRFFVFIFLLN